jgi:ABC-type sugar transport system ATPase subunit
VDGPERFRLRQEFRAAVREGGATILYVTNNREEVAALADRVLVLEAGRALALGAPLDLLKRPPCPAVAACLAPWPPAVFPARIHRDHLLLADGVRIGIGVLPEGLPGECLAAIRVEGWQRDTGNSPFFLEGVVSLVERFSPDRALVHLERPSGWRYLEMAGNPPQPGERLRLMPRPGGLLLFAADGNGLLWAGP